MRRRAEEIPGVGAGVSGAVVRAAMSLRQRQLASEVRPRCEAAAGANQPRAEACERDRHTDEEALWNAAFTDACRLRGTQIAQAGAVRQAADAAAAALHVRQAQAWGRRFGQNSCPRVQAAANAAAEAAEARARANAALKEAEDKAIQQLQQVADQAITRVGVARVALRAAHAAVLVFTGCKHELAVVCASCRDPAHLRPDPDPANPRLAVHQTPTVNPHQHRGGNANPRAAPMPIGVGTGQRRACSVWFYGPGFVF